MVKRIKKPPVELRKRREWFSRYEDGESAQQIAKTDGYDIRTVKKQIDLERQEREIREARSIVLRKALEDHYADLCSFAQKLDSDLNSERSKLAGLREDRKWSALHEHLPRSVIWKSFERWEELHQEKDRLEEVLNRLVEKQIESRTKKKFGKSLQEMGLSIKHVEAISNHIRYFSLGQRESVRDFDFYKISEDKESETVKLIRETLDIAMTWKEFEDLSRLWTELERVRRVLSDELAVIILRRVVPGRCRYCPL